MSTQAAPGSTSHPDTPGPYCLARCYCGTCPQYASQRRATELLAEQERGQRAYRQAERDGRRFPRGRR